MPPNGLLPGEPLADWLERRPWTMRGVDSKSDDKMVAAIARRVYAIRHGSSIGLVTADRICCFFGVHPLDVWGDDYWNAGL